MASTAAGAASSSGMWAVISYGAVGSSRAEQLVGGIADQARGLDRRAWPTRPRISLTASIASLSQVTRQLQPAHAGGLAEEIAEPIDQGRDRPWAGPPARRPRPARCSSSRSRFDGLGGTTTVTITCRSPRPAPRRRARRGRGAGARCRSACRPGCPSARVPSTVGISSVAPRAACGKVTGSS